MKKIIMFLATAALYTSLITGNATAQRSTSTSLPALENGNTTGSTEDKKTAVGNVADPVDKTAIKEMESNLKAAKANLKVSNHLSKTFKNVSGLIWSTEEKVIIATFKMNEKSARVVYDKKGHWLYTIINYQEDQMPRDVRSLVKQNYDGFNISLVQEVSQGDITLYKVHLEDNTKYKRILVCNGEITEFEEFRKNN
ncbi:MAG: hypothetical protein ABI760_11170 [Ferruginibacter sp.]